LEESLTIFRELGDKRNIAYALNGLGSVALDQGDLVEARALLEESLATCRALGDKRNITFALSTMGSVALSQGDYAIARARLEENLAICRELGDKRGIADALDGFAHLAHREQQERHAARLWGAATSIREKIATPRTPRELEKYNQQIAQARAVLGQAVFDAAFTEGSAMSLDQAIEYAFDGLQD
ncbi:MAG TPA: tetratricopeptide repeat protein, partial [Chthonomonadaceae bacterium]|nr:tetratricopeptide repeat protein [Chthonomonadaceae bacterium]